MYILISKLVSEIKNMYRNLEYDQWLVRYDELDLACEIPGTKLKI
jgi:hypothetical protein